MVCVLTLQTGTAVDANQASLETTASSILMTARRTSYVRMTESVLMVLTASRARARLGSPAAGRLNSACFSDLVKCTLRLFCVLFLCSDLVECIMRVFLILLNEVCVFF